MGNSWTLDKKVVKDIFPVWDWARLPGVTAPYTKTIEPPLIQRL